MCNIIFSQRLPFNDIPFPQCPARMLLSGAGTSQVREARENQETTKPQTTASMVAWQ